MTTVERMLAILGVADDAREARERGALLAAASAPRGRRNGRRSKSRRARDGESGSAVERLEQRDMLAVSTFATTDNGGIVTIVAEGGDNVYIQQVATAPQSLYVADNSSFQRRTVVGGPQFNGLTPGTTTAQYLQGVPFDTISTILVRSGTERVETVPQSPQGYPMAADATTVFALPDSVRVGAAPFRSPDNLFGTISLVQSNGTKAFWSFSNAGSGQPVFVGGVGFDPEAPAKIGDVYPIAISVNDAEPGGPGGPWSSKSTITVTWSESLLANTPVLEFVSWIEQDYTTDADPFPLGQRSASSQSPAANRQGFISLQNAAGSNLSPIIPTTFQGNLVVDGVNIAVTCDTQGTLFFGGRKTATIQSSNSYESVISGKLITGTTPDPDTNEYRRGLLLDISGQFNVSLQSARYALASGGEANSATVFAGHDITAGLDINLTSPGSSINIDSPVTLSTDNKNIVLRASTVDLNAPTDATAGGRMQIGHPIADPQTAFETAGAVAEIRDGKVTKISVREGFGGAGYDAASPPKVTIGQPQSVKANLLLIGVTDGSIPAGGIKITNPGAGYAAAPRVIIDPPKILSGTQAAATAILATDKTGAITGINVDSAGSGYTQRPKVTLEGQATTVATARADIRGSIGLGNVVISSPGFGYVADSRPELVFTSTSGTGAAGYAQVNASGSVESIVITAGGSGYGLDTTVSVGVEPTSSGTQAEAEVEIDPATTRIVAFKITNPGSGYGRQPDVKVAPPLAKSPAGRPVATLDPDGGVASIDFATGRGLAITVQKVDSGGSVRAGFVAANAGGSGYAVGDLVNIDSTLAGRSAQFRIQQVDPNTGAVLRVAVVSGGTAYAAGERLAHDGVASRGRGYDRLSPPRVFVARPDDPVGRQATARVELDQFGSITRFVVTDPGSGYAAAPAVEIAGLLPLGLTETVRFNAAVTAGVYDIEAADDPATPVERSLLLVSRSGAIAAGQSKNGLLAADAVNVEIHQGDIRVEGRIVGKSQSYLMQSNPRDVPLAPFVFTTELQGSGVQRGAIEGGTVAVTLANDLPTPFQSAVAFNVVSLSTAIDSIRLRASRNDGQPYAGPYPYKGEIFEKDDINVDAVAASSFPIFLTAGGDINFRAALATSGGLQMASGGNLMMSAPVSTEIDQIVLSAKNLQLDSSVAVTAMPADDVRQDIILEATAGEIRLNGGIIQAPGQVSIRQKTGKKPKVLEFEGVGEPLVRNATASIPIAVTDDFTFDEVGVTISLAVSDPNSSLTNVSASLVSPSGVAYPLFGQFSRLSGKAMVDTVFNTSSSTRIFRGIEPYTGTFQAEGAEGLAQLFNRASAKGTWQLQVTDRRFFGSQQDIGAITKATLSLTNPVGAPAGDVYGTSLIRASSLLVDAEGSVGNPANQPLEPEFYLRTDVDTVVGSAGGSFSLRDSGAVDVASLRAKGIVSLRADGVDPADGRAALVASLADIPALDVSAPAGSIDVQVTTASALEIGNKDLLSLARPFRQGLPAMMAAGNVTIRTVGGSQGGDVVVYDAPMAGSSSREVRLALITMLTNAVYSPGVPGVFPGRIDATVNESFTSRFPGFTSSLGAGNRILVAGGVAGIGDAANGIYELRRVGGATSKWQLVRAVDADTLGELPTRTFVTPVEGPLLGRVYQLTHQAATATEFGKTPITVREVALKTNIGSDDVDDLVSFVVSTTDGTNTSPGSLGKMIGLRQRNDTSNTANPEQQVDFLFGSAITGPIQLSQELPVISKAFAIDGKRRFPAVPAAAAAPVTIDGSRVLTTRINFPVGLTMPVDGFTFSSSAGGSTAASIANVVVGGFSRGAGIKVDGASNVVINKVNVGVDLSGGRLANLKGIVVTAAAPGTTTGVTISNSTIGGGSVAGVSLEGAASGVKIFGTKIGVPTAANTVGILASSSGANAVGAVGDVAAARNAISFNGTGMRLTAGSVTVLNTDVVDNAADGIAIAGGSHVVGRSPRDALANKILGNGGFGISIATNALAATQQVRGNLLGVGKANTKVNVGVAGSPAAAALGFTPNASTGLDRFDNQHTVAAPPTGGGTGGGTGGTPKPPTPPKTTRIPFAWRPRRR